MAVSVTHGGTSEGWRGGMTRRPPSGSGWHARVFEYPKDLLVAPQGINSILTFANLKETDLYNTGPYYRKELVG